ncbi:MAG: hypothetical protein MRY21_06400 [Simkaniaceae bacterium]|nr:hypothetical protein [Simkaniaceae bacterium]
MQFLFALIVSYIMIATQLFIDIFWVLSCLPLRRLLAKMKAIFVTLLLPLRRLLKALLIPLQHIAARFMRVLKAESSACCCEKQSRFSLFVGKRIKKFQTDWNKEQDRPLKLIAFQFLDTIWLIPTCIVLACLQIVFVLFAAIWLAIRILFSICFDHLLSRNSKLMSFIPTGIGYLLLGSHCLFLLAKDALALIYKLFRCLNVFKAAASVKEFLMYIPKAIFEK